jgi:prepilin-type N-terminal cleavage/methylation domain-containing protein
MSRHADSRCVDSDGAGRWPPAIAICNPHSAIRNSRGFTLIEMLVAVAVTMIMMLAVVQVFQILGNSLDKGRAIIEMSGQLRNVSHRLQQDLDGITCRTTAWTPVDAGDGYLEYFESGDVDSSNVATMWGDCPSGVGTNLGDILMFTARSKGRPFVGRSGGTLIESELAEIFWWVHWDDTNGDSVRDPGEVSIYRRVLLIRPDLGTSTVASGTTVATFLQSNDISVRPDTATTLRTNSLADLTLRQNRTLHSTSYPYSFSTTPAPIPASNSDFGSDVALNNVVAFDVRVWDPLAPIYAGTNVAVSPGDPGWAALYASGTATLLGRGAYVDLNYSSNANPPISFYSSLPNAKFNSSAVVYTTWPFFYERDGTSQDTDTPTARIDEGTDGFDTPGGLSTAADDPGEYETSPPYPHPIAGYNPPALRGLQVRIRIVEPGSRQVRQATVVSDFVPE